MIAKLLIANRGEIACRIIKTCQRLGVQTVAVYSEIDDKALHVQMADEAYCLGPAPARDSYLHIDKILEIAKLAQVDAIHPGYGFLSENGDFAKKVSEAGIRFVGPSAQAMWSMASKEHAKVTMEKAGVPVIPGFKSDAYSGKDLIDACHKVGFPLMVKAAMGGGGKGMRIVERPEDLEAALESAKREALSSFNDDNLLIEKCVQGARHIEVQVFADHHGQVVHLFERDCSLQRRHQKVIEQAPAIHLKQSVRQTLYESAILAAKAIDYTNAGTVEFLVDNQQNVYFLEMNTRLQVEHPITEAITGFDLVEWQLLIAQGDPLPCQQSEIQCKGFAFEARIYAEDPSNQFLPSTGTIQTLLKAPQLKARFDLGVQAGDEISIYYDPILAKLIVHGQTRMQAVQKLHAALDQFDIVGITNNIPFLRSIAKSDEFVRGDFDTHFLESQGNRFITQDPERQKAFLLPAVLALTLHNKRKAKRAALASNDPLSPWGAHNAWRLNHPPIEVQTLKIGEQVYTARIQHGPHESYFVTLDDMNVSASMKGRLVDQHFEYHIGQQGFQALVHFFDDGLHLLKEGESFSFYLPSTQVAQDESSQEDSLKAPMPGIITNIWVQAGHKVDKGDKLLAMEAMKMEHTVSATKEGTIKSIYFKVGDQVQQGSKIFEFEHE